MGLGESLLHLEGKRIKDKLQDSEMRLENKRKNREAAMPDETKRRKAEAAKKRDEKLKTFASVEKVAKLCSGDESCCSEKCLEVRGLTVSLFFQFEKKNCFRMKLSCLGFSNITSGCLY